MYWPKFRAGLGPFLPDKRTPERDPKYMKELNIYSTNRKNEQKSTTLVFDHFNTWSKYKNASNIVQLYIHVKASECILDTVWSAFRSWLYFLPGGVRLRLLASLALKRFLSKNSWNYKYRISSVPYKTKTHFITIWMSFTNRRRYWFYKGVGSYSGKAPRNLTLFHIGVLDKLLNCIREEIKVM